MFIWTLDDVIGIVIIGSCIGYICIHSLIQAIKYFIEKKEKEKKEKEDREEKRT